MDMYQLRNFKDFLLLYNQISETCFNRCVNTFLTREITANEDLCMSNCAQKYIHANHKIMGVFMEVQPIMVNRRMQEINTTTQAQLEAQAQDQQLQNQQMQQNLQ